MDSASEVIWTRYAVNNQKLSRAQLQTCIEEQGQFRAKGLEKSLSEIIIGHGYVDQVTAYKLMTLEGMIPGYTMKEILGTGGLGIVYKAFAEKLNREVAIKILNPEYTDNAVILTRFLREIEISIKLEHPNIVKGLDSGRVEDIYYLVLEFIDGVSLSTYVSQFGPMGDEKVLSVAATTTNALYYAWKKGLTHRDIKPGNIMLSKTGQVKVCDFGLAKLADANIAVTLTGTIVGSPYYISPEQVTGVTLDYRSDIYSLGATLYFLATGRVMFDEKSMISACNAHVNKTPTPPSQVRPISAAIETLILKMVNKNPEDRCKSPEDFMSYLKTIVKDFKQAKTLDNVNVANKPTGKPESESKPPANLLDTKTKTSETPAKMNTDAQETKKTPSEIALTASGERIFEQDLETMKSGQLVIKTISFVGLLEEDKKIIGEELQKHNLEITSFESGEDALRAYSNTAPDIVMCSSALKGKMSIWDFISALKQAKDLHRKLHVVLLEEKEDPKQRMQAMLLGIKHYLPKPISPQTIATILDYANKTTYRETTKMSLPKLKGNLSVMSLPELLQTLHASEKIGMLTLQGNDQEGVIYISQGKILHAVLGKQSPKSSLFDMMSWQKGTFIFQEMPAISIQATLNWDVMQILLDAMRVVDEIGRIREMMAGTYAKDFDLVRIAILEDNISPQTVLDQFPAFTALENKDSFIKFLIDKNFIDSHVYKTLKEISDAQKSAKLMHTQTAFLTKGGDIINKEGKKENKEVNKDREKSTTTSKISKPTSAGSGPKNKIQDVILQQLLLSLNIVNMSQISECISVQVDLQLQGIYKALADIIMEQGYVDAQYMQNLRYFRDEEGESLIPNYEIVNVIGEGGLAVVYLGRNVHTNETVAIKIFAPISTDASSTIARFMREAEAAKKLNHPNIVRANDFGTIHGIYYLVMEYIPGLSLSQIISKMGRLEEQKALAILEQLADALTYAWQQNIIHRDIKPGNILSDGDILKICDLGLAKAIGSEIEVTQEGSVVGTPQYMSPEQFQPEKDLDFRTDVYSLGITFYVMLTGHLPFTANTKIGLAQAHLMQEPPPLEKFNVIVTKQTKALLMKMIAKDREDRGKEKDEIFQDVRAVRAGKFPKNYSAKLKLPYKKIGGVAAAILLVVIIALFVLTRENQWEAMQKEIPELISKKQYTMALDKISQSSLPKDQKEKLVSWVNDEQAKETEIIEIAPSQNAPVYEEKIKITGSCKTGNLDYILVNNRRADIISQGTNAWRFEAEVSLSLGRNEIKISISGKSGYKKEVVHNLVRAFLDTTPPVITLTEPKKAENGKRSDFLNSPIALKGYATDNEKVTSVIINGNPVPTLVSSEKLMFDVPIELKEGGQVIQIQAKDEKGNEAVFSFEAYLQPKGWFGEQMPAGFEKGKEIGEYIWIKDRSVMVYVPEGEFWYGASRNEAKKVYLSSYYIDKFEVTWKQFKAFCKQTNREDPKKPKWGAKDPHPVVEVSYADMTAYATWLGKQIPTVSQWSKAARGGVNIPDWKVGKIPVVQTRNPDPFRLYPWGNALPNALDNKEKVYRCNYCADDSFVGQAADGYMYTARVGEFAAWNSPYGCADMAGNVFEVCSDYFAQDYLPTEGDTDPTGPTEISDSRVKIGGGFYSLANRCVIGITTKFAIERGDTQTGFRLVVPVKK